MAATDFIWDIHHDSCLIEKDEASALEAASFAQFPGDASDAAFVPTTEA